MDDRLAPAGAIATSLIQSATQPSHLAMKHVATTVLSLAVLVTPGAGQASETFQLCGPDSTGFIRTGRQIVCVGGSPDWRRNRNAPASAAQPSQATSANQTQPTVTVKAGANKEIDDLLNSADMRFRDNDRKNGCEYVRMAISQANDSGAVSASGDQKTQIKTYADQCNLRF